PAAQGGTFYLPTIIANASLDMEMSQEETFGPVAACYRFSTEEEVIKMANDTEYGLSSYFYTRDIGRLGYKQVQIYHNYFNGGFLENAAEFIEVRNPATETIFAKVACATPDEARLAVEKAKIAQQLWRKLSSQERGEHLHRLASVLTAQAKTLAPVLANETGKSLEDATNEVLYAAEILRYHAGWARRIEGEVIPSDNAQENIFLMREPLGVAVCLIPFNFPIYTLLRKIAPALITGNTVIVRPSNHTPCSALAFAQVVQQAALPPGVVNIMCMSHETAATLCTQPAVAMISLTGSVYAGQQVLEYCKHNIAKASLELGGKTPAIVADDTHLQAAAQAIVASKTTHSGQLCTAVERVYAQAKIHDKLLALLKTYMQGKTLGNRQIDPLHMGPLVNAAAQTRTHAMVMKAIAQGATLETGGYLPDGPGYFYPPTLLSHCRQDMEIVQEETFAPILCVLAYENIEDALSMANDHQFGLSSVLFTERYRDIMLAANTIEAGELYINRIPADPYQGYHAGWKRSGLGGDDGKHGMLEFTQTRLVVMPY
ncbi:unnamed protein product, partial [Darwinula stevensoni]